MRQSLQIVCFVPAFMLLISCSREVTVKIGVAVPMSGALAEHGKEIAHGAEIAVDELNTEHFMIHDKRAHFELVVEDDKALPGEGKLAAQRLVDAGVSAVFGHYNSGVSIAAAPVYAAAGIPQLSVSTNPTYTRMGLKTTFRITADDVQQGATLAHLIRDKLHAKSLYMVDDLSIFGIGIVDEVGKALGTEKSQVPRDSVEVKSADYVDLAHRIMNTQADVVFFGGDEAVGLPLLKALRAAGSPSRFVVTDAMCNASTVRAAGGSADNYYYCTVAGVPPSWLSAGIDFKERYKTKFGTPGAYSTLAYDGVHVLTQAMQQAGSSNPMVYLPVLAKGSFDGKVQGSVEFDGKGNIKDGVVVIFQSIDGQLVEKRNLQ